MDTGGSDPFRSRDRRAGDAALATRNRRIVWAFVAAIVLGVVGLVLLLR